jgi:hypothetical protein
VIVRAPGGTSFWRRLEVIATVLTVVAAALLGGAIAADIAVVVVLAAVALVAIGVYNGVRNYVGLCDLRRD